MGVPVITYQRRYNVHAHNVGATLLSRINDSTRALIAHSEEEYVNIAVSMANNATSCNPYDSEYDEPCWHPHCVTVKHSQPTSRTHTPVYGTGTSPQQVHMPHPSTTHHPSTPIIP